MMKLNYVTWAFLPLLLTVVYSDDALKNHRAEKRQDDSFLFFGGWRPIRQVKAGSGFLQSSATNRYHDILSALPNSFDATANYYTHAMPSRYQKDIYSYYPKPVIKSTPKKNTPVYMERYKPQRQQAKYNGGSGVSNAAPQFIDLQSIDLKQLQDLHEIILQAKHLPLSNLNLPIENSKPLEIVEVSLQSVQQGHQSYVGGRNNRNQRNRNSQRNKGYKRVPQTRRPVQQPVQYEYLTFPKTNPILPQILPKEIEISPIKLPHVVPGIQGIQDVVDLKNVQIIEVPIPSVQQYEIPRNKGRGSSRYTTSGTRSSTQQQYTPPVKNQQQKPHQSFSYFAQQFEQPKNQYASTQLSGNHIQAQPNIEAELIKLDDETLKSLLSNLQILEKNPHELLKYFPIGNIGNGKDDNVQLILSLPGADHNQGGSNSHGPSYEIQQPSKQGGNYGNEEQYGDERQQSSYESKGIESLRVNSGGYYKGDRYPNFKHNSAVYESEPQSPKNSQYENSNYQSVQVQSGYEQQSPKSGKYEKSNYQSVEVQSGYEQQKSYQEESQQKPENHYQVDQQQYSQQKPENHYQMDQQQYSQQEKNNHEEQQGGSYKQREQTYIQIISPHTDENGYRREPVLALEIQHGQSIEDAIKSLDTETLQKIGAHTKDGIEIEVVEVPMDEYASSESKKTETVVSAQNSTVTAKAKKTVKILKS